MVIIRYIIIFSSPLSLDGFKMSGMMSPSHIQQQKTRGTNSKWGATEANEFGATQPLPVCHRPENQIKCVTTENQTPLPLNLFRYYNDYHHHHQFLSLCLLLSLPRWCVCDFILIHFKFYFIESDETLCAYMINKRGICVLD